MTESYEKRIRVQATPDQIYRAIATKRGITGWWTHLVDGAPSKPGNFSVRFDGMDQQVDLEVVSIQKPNEVIWFCLRHSAFPEWRGTRMIFRMTKSTRSNISELDFIHEGLTPQLGCYGEISEGWNYFLKSLTAYAETGRGKPFRKQD